MSNAGRLNTIGSVIPPQAAANEIADTLISKLKADGLL